MGMGKNKKQFKQVFYFGKLKTIKIAPKCKCCNRIDVSTNLYKTIVDKIAKYDVLIKEAQNAGNKEAAQNAFEKFKLLAEMVEWDF